MNTGIKELKSILEELDELRLPHMAAALETLYKLHFASLSVHRSVVSCQSRSHYSTVLLT